MRINPHSARDYADALAALLPPGAAWVWPVGGLGDSVLLSTAAELSRIDAETQAVLDTAIETHRPKTSSWHISEYRRIAAESLGGLIETMPRRAAAIGGHVGDRCWSHDAPTTVFPVALVQVDHLIRPGRIGGHIGDRCWGHRSRYVLRVRYYRSVVAPSVLWAALSEFQQAHVFL